ncbi:MAG: SGNH/GDSL hydrolase family protein [bacterium]
MGNGLKNLLLLIGALLLTLLLAEMLVRLLTPQQLLLPGADLWKPDSLCGYRHISNADIIVNMGEQPVRFRTDSLGYRSGVSEAGSPADISLLLIGDSFLEGLSLDDDDTIPAILEQRLASLLHLRVCAVNAGVSGWNPNHYYAEARRSLALAQYDLGIVFLYIMNDVVSAVDTCLQATKFSSIRQFRIPGNFRRIEWMDAVFGPLNDRLSGFSHLYVFVKEKLLFLLRRWGWAGDDIPAVLLKSESEASGWEPTILLCSQIRAEFERAKTQVLFVFLPADYQVHEHLFYDYLYGLGISTDAVDLGQPQRWLSKRGLEAGLTILDPLLYLRHCAQAGETLYGSRDRHFNAAGSRALVDYILPYVQQLLQLKLSISR